MKETDSITVERCSIGNMFFYCGGRLFARGLGAMNLSNLKYPLRNAQYPGVAFIFLAVREGTNVHE